MTEQKNDPVFRTHGNVGRDPERRQAGDKDIVEFSLATSMTYGKDAATRWYTCTIWKPELGDLVLDTIQKGDRVAVEGFLRKRDYEGKDGTPKVSWDLSTTRVGIIDWLRTERMPREEGPVIDPYAEEEGTVTPEANPFPLDDLPF